MIWTIAFEAPEESDEDKAAVAYVILNRTQNGRWGDNIKDVVTHPWQSEPWMTKRQDMDSGRSSLSQRSPDCGCCS